MSWYWRVIENIKKNWLVEWKMTKNLVNFHVSSRKSKVQSFRWKRTEELCLVTLKSNAKFEEKLTLGSENGMRNLVNFNASSGKSEKLHFDVMLLLKVYYAWAKKVLRSYVITLKMMQNLKRNWLVLWKMTWKIWWILAQHSKVSKRAL